MGAMEEALTQFCLETGLLIPAGDLVQELSDPLSILLAPHPLAEASTQQLGWCIPTSPIHTKAHVATLARKERGKARTRPAAAR